jgi:zinc/manganese transport system substrate-binding protein
VRPAVDVKSDIHPTGLASEGRASTYLGMFEHNLNTLMAALKP